MKTGIRSILVGIAAGAVMMAAAAPYAKEAPPKPDKMKKLSFPDFKEFDTKNGMEVLVVEHREQPVVSIYVIIKAGGAVDPTGKESLASFTVDQLNKGTKTRTALELAEWIESVGGSVGSFSQQDYSAITVTILSEYLDRAYEYLQDVLRNPVFPDVELDLLRKQAKTGLEFELSSPEAMARRHLRNLIYGDHPYAKQPSVESVESITRDDVVAFYDKNIVPNNLTVAVVGDVKWKDVRKAMKEYLGDWERGTPQTVTYEGAPESGATKVYLYHKPGAVQTEIFVGHLAPKAGNPDWPAMIVGNRVLGAGSDARLFANIREEKGWTYRVNSRFDRERDFGTFIARTPVRTEVTDSALVELLAEIKRIKSEPVTAEELKNAKSYLIGNFPISIETPDRIAAQVTQYKLLGLGKEDLESYRDRLAAVTIEDVSRVMDKYLHPDDAYIVLVGDAMEIKDKVAVVADVELFDIAGEPMSIESMAVEPVDYEYDTSMLKNMKATYALTYQEMAIGEMDVSMEKKGAGSGDVIRVSSSIAGMISMDQTMEFSAEDLSPIAFKSTMQAGPQSMGAEFSFSAGAVSGTVLGGDSPEPKEVAFDLVDGTIIDGALEYAIGCLPLAVDKTYRFPVIDSQTGSLQTVNVKVMEMVNLETAAGSFATYKVKVQRAAGDAYLYVGKDAPHILVKQEVPAQGMSIELKSLAN
ncbi:MAG: insulinase family protein [Candidatus Krumholzibacteriia bacterium]